MSDFSLPQHIFGIHDAEGARVLSEAGKPGWVVVSQIATDAPQDFSALANAGHGVIVRLNNGYGSAGTIPFSTQYDAFAAACANFVARSSGAHIWIIGNETNLKSERPGNGSPQEEVITPERYGVCFQKCRAAIKNVPGHANDWVIPAPPGPWNPETVYPGNAGDFVVYFRDLLNECLKRNAPPDALALHTYSAHDLPMDAALIESEERNGAWHWQFRVYRDFLGAVPAALKNAPVLITEAQHLPWENRDVGWIQKAYAEINAWNSNPSHQAIQAFCLFRWRSSNDAVESGWGISDKNRLLQDFRAALQNDYRARFDGTPIPVVTKPLPDTTTPSTEILPLAKARWFVEETIRQLEANNGAAARKILTETVTPWFYASAPQHSTSLPEAHAQTTARWHCEEATRCIEAGKLREARDLLLDHVLAWLNSPGPGALGILSMEPPAKPKRSTKKSAAPKTRAKKPKPLLLSADKPDQKTKTKK